VIGRIMLTGRYTPLSLTTGRVSQSRAVASERSPTTHLVVAGVAALGADRAQR
jgi:hypothetical protein